MSQTRPDGRGHDQARPIEIVTNFQTFPEGSVLYRCGGTRVLIAASLEEYVPPWMKGKGTGWVTAEYEMHPRANRERQRRARSKGRIDGRSSEIQRLIGRSLRAAVDMRQMGERMISVDCDVLDADGGTRTAAITGGFVALAMALDLLRQQGQAKPGVIREPIAAISVGLREGARLLDLNYQEDFAAEVDLNVVGTAGAGIVEVQGTAEGAPVARADFDGLVDLAVGALPTLVEHQRAALQKAGVDLDRLMGPG
jgi:ribonuclease PH